MAAKEPAMKMKLTLFGAVGSLALWVLGCGAAPVTGGTTDSGTAGSDGGGAARVDSGTQPFDSGTQVADSGSGGAVDSGTPVRDAGPSGDAGISLNGCTDGKFIDSTVTTNTNVAFGGGLGESYSPACVTIAVGRSVTFKGSFQYHNLNKGSPSDLNAGSPNNPITQVTSGSEKVVTFPTAGDYPYICEFHNASGMMGVVRVR